MQKVWRKTGRSCRSLTVIPEEMQDHMFALMDSFYKCEWEKFDKALAGLVKSRKETSDKIE